MTLGEVAILLVVIALTAAAQAETTYSHLSPVDGWVTAVIFSVVYVFIGVVFGKTSEEREHKKICLNELLPEDSPLRKKAK